MKLKRFYKEIIGSSFAIAGIIIALINPLAHATPVSISRVSLDTGGGDPNAYVQPLDISDDGRYVLVSSGATDLVSGDTNSNEDLFVIDTIGGTTQRVNLSTTGTQLNNTTNVGKISGDGRYVVFQTQADNVGFSGTNNLANIYLRDRTLGTTSLVSVNTSGSPGNGHSQYADVSDDGRFVLIQSNASDLVSGDTNSKQDIFIRDMLKGTTALISKSESGTLGNDSSNIGAISCDGRYATFNSAASNLVSGDTNTKQDIFLYDSLGGVLKDLTISADNHSYTSTDLTCDGKKILLDSWASNLVSGDNNSKRDIFIYNTASSTFQRVSLADDESEPADHTILGSMSADGRYVAFRSYDANLVSGDTNTKADIFLRDTTSGTTIRLSEKTDGTQSNGHSPTVFLSNDGAYAAFASDATNLVSGDNNAYTDTYYVNTGVSPIACY